MATLPSSHESGKGRSARPEAFECSHPLVRVQLRCNEDNSAIRSFRGPFQDSINLFEAWRSDRHFNYPDCCDPHRLWIFWDLSLSIVGMNAERSIPHWYKYSDPLLVVRTNFVLALDFTVSEQICLLIS